MQGKWVVKPIMKPFVDTVDTGELADIKIICRTCYSLSPYRATAGDNEKRPPIMAAGESPWETQCVLASCQSLALLEGEVVGDPLEKACITAINWTINKGLVC